VQTLARAALSVTSRLSRESLRSSSTLCLDCCSPSLCWRWRCTSLDIDVSALTPSMPPPPPQVESTCSLGSDWSSCRQPLAVNGRRPSVGCVVPRRPRRRPVELESSSKRPNQTWLETKLAEEEITFPSRRDRPNTMFQLRRFTPRFCKYCCRWNVVVALRKVYVFCLRSVWFICGLCGIFAVPYGSLQL